VGPVLFLGDRAGDSRTLRFDKFAEQIWTAAGRPEGARRGTPRRVNPSLSAPPAPPLPASATHAMITGRRGDPVETCVPAHQQQGFRRPPWRTTTGEL
jgi:hypothetical protein